MSCNGSYGLCVGCCGELNDSVGGRGRGCWRRRVWESCTEDKWFSGPVEGYKVRWKRGSWATRDDGAVGEEKKSATGDEVWTHTYAEFCLRLGIGGGVVCAGERVAFVCVLCDHTASAEGEGSAGGFGTAKELVRGGWGATCIDEGIAGCCDGFM